jgi:GWxTD domain-containing protein
MRKLLAVILTALLLSPQINSQEEKQVKLFNLDVLNFFSAEGTKSRVDIYVEVPLDKVEFKRSKIDKSAFVTKFDLTIEVKDKSDATVYSNVSKEEITTLETKQEYLMQNSQILTRNLFLQPGEYKVRVAMYEQNTKNRYETIKEISVKDFASLPLSISDVMIVSRLTTETGKKMITPDVARNVGLIDTFYLFYYVYRNPEDAPIDVTCKIVDPDNKEVYSNKQTIDFSAGSTFQNQVFMPVPTDKLSYGKFTVEINAASGSTTSNERAFFENENPDFPMPLKDIDVLISQLQYIAKDDEMSYMKDGATDTEKQKRFIAFWEKKDPSPGTKRNEVMQEYYKRIRIADKMFSTSYTPGWRSDMGMVFIIFGMPDNIDRHPYEMDTKPYEVWDYYSINKQFVFVDDTGFGDYRLITPIWDTFRYNR